MTYENAWYNVKQGKSIPYKKETLATIRELIEQKPCDDAISRKAVLDEMGDVNMDIYTDEVKEFVKSLPPVQPKARWIPVSERLPEESLNSVIGWDRYRESCVFVQYIDGHFQNRGNTESFDIVAWMPLPEPYKAESEE